MSEPLSALSLDAEQKRAEEQARREHEHRVAHLLDEGWQQTSDTSWLLDTSDPRWSETSAIEICGPTPEDASRSAWHRQMEREAVAKARAER